MSTLTDALHLSMTDDFICANPISITVHRSSVVATGTGGYTMATPTDLPPQTVRRVGIAGQPRNVVGANGEAILAESVLICRRDADLVVGDVFTDWEDGKQWKVLAINVDPPWRMEASVIRHG